MDLVINDTLVLLVVEVLSCFVQFTKMVEKGLKMVLWAFWIFLLPIKWNKTCGA